MIIGIDASNLRGGGGVTYLFELLRVANPYAFNISRVVVWSGKDTLLKIEDKEWLLKVYDPLIDYSLPTRIFWQRFKLKQIAKKYLCDLLFVPGGLDISGFVPIVTLSQNLLPFEMKELMRYRFSLTTLRLLLLRSWQSNTFRKSSGVIFLTQYAETSVLRVTGKLQGQIKTIPHGISSRFQSFPKRQRVISTYSSENPYRILYVSIVNQYKHQWCVVEAISILRRAGLPIELDLVGPAYPPSLIKLEKSIEKWDSAHKWVRYHGAIPYHLLHDIYVSSDLGVFASSCENMPIILMEMMASGLPLACSNCGPMPEILGDAGVYFDPELPIDIARVIQVLVDSPELRRSLAIKSYQQVQQYSWKRCADETFEFLKTIAPY